MSSGAGEPLASLRGVTVRFGRASADPALIDVTLDVERGERVALLGASGAGKSTILDVLGGRRQPSDGRAFMEGADLARLSGQAGRSIRARIGTIAQRSELVPSLSVHRNVLLGRAGVQRSSTTLLALLRRSDPSGVQAALAAVGLDGFADRAANSLSGGERQRASIARLHYQSPDLVLADEPVANLDPTRSSAIIELLVGLVDERPGRALVVALHDPDLARRHFDRIIGIEHGGVQFDLPALEVSDELVSSLYADEPTVTSETTPVE